MKTCRPGVLTNTTLRLLSEREMEFGLDPMDQALMHYHANVLRLEQEIHRLAQRVEALAREAASRRLVEGQEAYVQVEGIEGIVRQNADGTRELVEVIDGQPILIRSL